MRVNGVVVLEMVSAHKNGQMVHVMRVSGAMEKHMEKVLSHMLMETCILANGPMIRPTVMAGTVIKMELLMRVIGKMTSRTEKVRKIGPMAQFMKEVTRKARNTALEYTSGVTALNSKAIG